MSLLSPIDFIFYHMLCTTDKRCLCYIMYLCTYVYILLYYIDTYEFHNCTKTNINLVISFVFDLSTNPFPMIECKIFQNMLLLCIAALEHVLAIIMNKA